MKGEKFLMRYVIADIHGCYDAYDRLLTKINFSDEDELYILGDVVDKGYSSFKVLLDMMERKNVFPILGNHDLIAIMMLKKLKVKIKEENVHSYLKDNDLKEYMQWLKQGGGTTISDYLDMDEDESDDIIDYLEKFASYYDITVNGKRYILVHAGLNNFDENKKLEDYKIQDLLFYRMDYSKRYFSDENTYIITGHTPTTLIREDKKPLIYMGNGHIAIDCGCAFGGRLAAYCIDTNEVYYEEEKYK